MSADAKITQAWADGEYDFRLGLGEIRELEDKCNAGICEILQNLQIGKWRFDNLRETIRLGLIGAGMPPVDALKLIKRYFDDKPLLQSIPLACKIIEAVLLGVPDDQIKKEQPLVMETVEEK